MKSCLGILFVFATFVSVVGGGALIWYLSNTAEFSRKDPAIATAPATPPAARPVTPPATPPRTQPAQPRTPPKPIPQEIPRSKPAAPKPSNPSTPFGEREP